MQSRQAHAPLPEMLAQDIQDPAGTSAIVAAGILASVEVLLRDCKSVQVILLAVMPRGERWVTPLASPRLFSTPPSLMQFLSARRRALIIAWRSGERDPSVPSMTVR